MYPPSSPPPQRPGESTWSRPIHMIPHQHSTHQLPQRRKIWSLFSMMYLWEKTETHWVLIYWQLYHHLYITLLTNSHLRYDKTQTKKPVPLLLGIKSHWRSADRHKNQMVPSGIHLGHIQDIENIQKLIKTYIRLSIKHGSHSKPSDISIVPHCMCMDFPQWVSKIETLPLDIITITWKDRFI